MSGDLDPLYAQARRGLLDGRGLLDRRAALGPHLDAMIIIGA